jgi:predicted nuclease of predicted toxin-antitoxin system
MIWLDAHLPPRLAKWVSSSFQLECEPLRELGLRDAQDIQIFERARKDNVIVMTKDKDFADLVAHKGPPPKVIWLRCGNTSEDKLKEILKNHLLETLKFLESDDLVEIR